MTSCYELQSGAILPEVQLATLAQGRLYFSQLPALSQTLHFPFKEVQHPCFFFFFFCVLEETKKL